MKLAKNIIQVGLKPLSSDSHPILRLFLTTTVFTPPQGSITLQSKIVLADWMHPLASFFGSCKPAWKMGPNLTDLFFSRTPSHQWEEEDGLYCTSDRHTCSYSYYNPLYFYVTFCLSLHVCELQLQENSKFDKPYHFTMICVKSKVFSIQKMGTLISNINFFCNKQVNKRKVSMCKSINTYLALVPHCSSNPFNLNFQIIFLHN